MHQLHCKSQMTLQHDSDCTPLLNSSPITAPQECASILSHIDPLHLNLKHTRLHLQSPTATNSTLEPRRPYSQVYALLCLAEFY